MNKLLPTSYDTALIYKCPQCEIEYWKTIKEVTKGQPTLSCNGCGFIGEIELLTQPRFSVKLAKCIKNIKHAKTNHSVIERAESLVKAQGFSNSEAKLYVKNALQKYNIQSVAELVRFSLAEAINEYSKTKHI